MSKLFLWIVAVVIIFGGGFFVWKKAQGPAPLLENENIRVTAPLVNAVIASPLIVTGEARGTWYFEASFPVELLDGDRNIVAVIPAQAQGDWMTENFVPFMATLDFTPPATDTGFLVLKKDNPSGLPEHDAHIEIPVRFR